LALDFFIFFFVEGISVCDSYTAAMLQIFRR